MGRDRGGRVLKREGNQEGGKGGGRGKRKEGNKEEGEERRKGIRWGQGGADKR